jgi:peptidoglycan hydrolase-like amidase
MPGSNTGRRKGPTLRATFAASITFALLALFAPSAGALAAPAAQAAPFAASYNATMPLTMGAGVDTPIPVTVTNTGTETWQPFAPPATSPSLGQVSLSYHWYTTDDRLVVWEGLRSALGAGDIAPGASRSATATVRAPSQPGVYFLKFAVVREGVAWAAPSQRFAVQVNPAYSAQFADPTVHAMLLGTAYKIPVTVTNSGTATWTVGGDTPVRLSYHWKDQAGRIVRWDGERSLLASDVAPGASVTIQLGVTAPATAGTYVLVIDLVREGVGWFADFGGTAAPTKNVVVSPIYYAFGWGVSASANAYVGQTRTIPVTLTNTGNVPWGTKIGEDMVNLSYHIHDAQGRLVLWEGQRTVVGALAVGETKVVNLTYTAPAALGAYRLTIDAVHEGVAWLSTKGSTPAVLPMTVDSGYVVGFGISTTPQAATIGARISIKLNIDNYGPRTLEAGGANPHRLSYHIYDSAGRLVTWDGMRGLLPSDLATNRSATVDIDVQLPSRVGDYRIKWDIVQEGVAWLSSYGNVMKEEALSVQPGVTFYGKGFGHGLGMSQWGAQGMASGALGTPKRGEEIVAHYYPGTELRPIDATNPNQQIRVLLSAPSSTGKYSCGGAVLSGSAAHLHSEKGFRLVDEGAGGREVFVAGPLVMLHFEATGGILNVYEETSLAVVYNGPGPLRATPVDPAFPTNLVEKGFYRGEFRLSNLGGTIRVVNFLSYDQYLKGVVPLEMLTNWHLEAYRAQAIAARSYAYQSWRGTASDYDVQDDQSDQCYGGVKMRNGRFVETEITNRAVDTTAGLLLTYQGQTIRAYFSSSSGGHTKPLGCFGFNVVISSAGSVSCNGSPQYLSGVADPADLTVSIPEPNRWTNWSVTFTSDEVRNAIIRYRGVDIGPLVSVDLSNRTPAGIGHVISVRNVGQFLSLDLPADRLLRDHLFLRSTMVRLAPW